MGFTDIMSELRSTLPEDTDLTVYDDLTSSYSELESSSAAKIADLQAQLDAAAAEIAKLKSVNYDLLMATSADKVEDETTDDEEPDNPDSTDENIDDFMENRGK